MAIGNLKKCQKTKKIFLENIIQKVYKKFNKGSALVFSLIVLSAMLLIAIGTSSVAVVKKKDASGTQFSVQAYQAADSGAQLALKKIELAIADSKTVGEIKFDTLPVGSCNAGVFRGIKDLADDKVFNVTFQKKGTDPANPDELVPVDCSDPATAVTDIKATGIYRDTVRAVGIGVGSAP